MKIRFGFSIGCIVLFAAAFSVNGQSRTKISLETDPSTFLLSGYSFHLRVQPAGCERWLLGAGTYSLRLPDVFVDLHPENRNEGWDAKIKSAYGVFGEYYFHRANQKWFIGEQVSIHNYRLKNNFESSAADANPSSVLLMTYVGYSWHPFKGSFYVKPWAGLGYTDRINGASTVGMQNYEIGPLFAFATFHLGYEF